MAEAERDRQRKCISTSDPSDAVTSLPWGDKGDGNDKVLGEDNKKVGVWRKTGTRRARKNKKIQEA